jgi:hypothetical protein
LIVTLPAFAESDFVLYSSWPLELAERLSLLPAPVAGVALVLELVAGVVAAGAASLLEEELLDELPHPASAASAISAGRTSHRPRLPLALA